MHGVSETTPKSVPCGSARQERRTRRVARTAAAAALLAASSLSAACRNHPEQPVPLLVVGVDGLEWRVVRELAQTGEIETLPRLAETGVSGLLDVPKPTLSPIIWTTIATGVGKNRHGIEGFTYRDENGRPRLFGSRNRRVKAVWNILGEAGLETWTIGWWATFPAEQVRGIMIAQVNAPLRRQGAIRKGGPSGTIAGGTFPRDLAPLVVKAVRHAEKDTALLIRKLIPTPQARWKDSARVLVEQSRWALIADRAYFRIALDLLSRRPPPALMQVYFGGADVLGHRF